ncbi:complement resistance protein TraT [Pelagibaculum spongiae]|uniref:Complement resistance protein TraT n=1 Tax=Pelagibaculum spongiae TaxID=2080658 RepID=A0A2V1H1R8_9GAMM|nr:complement resistance protein TraT [Pelagibaculum spongiae]PVZ69630.1 complement resistance protein TraT [Pelagibaculum spongiae]
MNNKTVVAAIVAASVMISGCAATHTAIAKRNLDVQTRMSATIFLDPVDSDKKTVFIQQRNTSDKQDLSLEQELRSALASRGYKVMNEPSQAYYLLQANILQAGKISPTAAEQAYSGGYGSSVGGVSAGAAAGGLATSSWEGVVGGGLVGGIVETAANAFVQDVTYTIITDIQLSERAGNVQVSESSQHDLKQGTSGARTVNYSGTSDWKRYQTRIVSTANQVNLDFPAALPDLKKGLANSLGGML